MGNAPDDDGQSPHAVKPERRAATAAEFPATGITRLRTAAAAGQFGRLHFNRHPAR